MTTKMYFPLGTSLELARSSSSLDVVQRAKQASVLFDQIVAEVGMYQIEVSGDSVPMQRYAPPESLTIAGIEAVRTLHAGTKAGLALRPLEGDQVEILLGADLPRLNPTRQPRQ